MILSLLAKAIAYGLIGLLVECIFTGAKSWLRKDVHGTGTTYLTMIPVYGTAALILEAIRVKLLWPFWLLAPIYMFVIYGSEFLWGYFYRVFMDRCPWDYGKGKWTIIGLINLQYWPFWLIVAMSFNKVSALLHAFVRFLQL